MHQRGRRKGPAHGVVGASSIMTGLWRARYIENAEITAEFGKDNQLGGHGAFSSAHSSSAYAMLGAAMRMCHEMETPAKR